MRSRYRPLMIDALECRRLLAFIVNGTPGNDLISLAPSGGNREYDVRLNGQLVGTTQEAEMIISGLGGNDEFHLAKLELTAISGDPFDVTFNGGLGNDIVRVFGLKGIEGMFRFDEQPAEGADSD